MPAPRITDTRVIQAPLGLVLSGTTCNHLDPIGLMRPAVPTHHPSDEWLVGYAAGHTPNPLYEEVCSGRTGHNEVVLVVFDPKTIAYEALLKTFWESHDPTQGMRQGNDVGTQYRSGIYTFSAGQAQAAKASRAMFQKELNKSGYGSITTEIVEAPEFYFAEDYHQQYLAKNPFGYCGLGGTGVSCPVGVKMTPSG